MTSRAGVLSLALGLAMAGSLAQAADLETSGKLLLTGGVTNIEGAGGGGLATWATITGYETVDEWGANVHATLVQLPDYQFRAGGVSVGFHDRVELSYTRQSFDTGECDRARPDGLKAGRRNLLHGDEVLEARRRHTTERARGAVRGQHVVGARAVVAERLGSIRT